MKSAKTLKTLYMRPLYAALLLVLTLSACSGSKHFTKLGAKQEAAGLMSEAAGSYYTALLKKRTNVDAQIGMKKTGQMVLNGMLNEFARAKNFGTNKEAVYSFHAARDYRDRIKMVGVELQMAEFYLTDYEHAKNAYLLELYEQGTQLLEEQKFQEAETRFKEIRGLDPNYKDAAELGDIAYLEPLYNEGKLHFQDKQYRAAHEHFEKVIARKSSYRDARDMRDQCIEKGRFTIAMMPFTNATTTPGLDARVSAYLLDAMIGIRDPFLRVVDREHMQTIINEQKLQMSGAVDEATAVQVGQIAGAQAILTGTVLSYSNQNGNVRSTVRDGYESYQVKRTNDEGNVYYETRYKPVKYTEFYNSSSVSISFQYKLISLQTGEIIKTDIIERSVRDEVLYARYDGNANDLYPASQTGVNLSRQDRQSLTSMLNGRQQLRNTTELSNDLFNQVTTVVTKNIGGEMLRLVP